MHTTHNSLHLPGAGRRYRMAAFAAAALAADLVAVGCAKYRAQPLDLEAHRAAYLERTPPAEIEAAEGGSTINCAQAEAIGLVLNPQLRIARLKSGVARATAENAGLWNDPTIGIDLTRLLEGSGQGWEVLGSVGLTVPISGRLEIEKARAGSAEMVELLRVARDEWLVRIAIRRAWAEWIAAQASFVSEERFVARVSEILRLVDTMEARGEISRIEARLFRLERMSAIASFQSLVARVESARLAILALIGLPPNAVLKMQNSPFETDSPVDTERMRQNIVATNPSVQVLRAEYLLAEHSVELEVERQYPDLQIGPGYGEQDGDRQFVLGLGIALPIFNANRQAIAEAIATREVARASAENAVESLLAEIAAVEIEWRASSAHRTLIAEEILPLMEAQDMDVRRLAQLGGEIDALILLESLKREHEVRLKLIETTHAESRAALRIMEIAGPRVPECAGASESTSTASATTTVAPRMSETTP